VQLKEQVQQCAVPQAALLGAAETTQPSSSLPEAFPTIDALFRTRGSAGGGVWRIRPPRWKEQSSSIVDLQTEVFFEAPSLPVIRAMALANFRAEVSRHVEVLWRAKDGGIDNA
jgi:hypothetical protein